ncbi:MAG: matrixin family metalloprotease [Candidatus Paceibacterota bacterium]|jgi:hypothetical protein
MYKSLKTIFAVIVIVIFVYIYRGSLLDGYNIIYDKLFPCTQPIAYSIGSFDTHFGMSKGDFLKVLNEAESSWEESIGRDLFVYQEVGGMSVNLIYDYRQQATERLRSLGIVVDGTKSSYDVLKSQYNVLKAEYVKEKTALASEISSFETRKDAYEKEVAYWNIKGGAPKSEYNRLQSELKYLSLEQEQIFIDQEDLNKDVDTLNALIEVLNRTAQALNINVAEYNAVGNETGKEFDEGIYRSSISGQEIDIYQFNTRNQLIRVLVHEFGHALGMVHVDDSEAIMYRLNQNTNLIPTKGDIDQLKIICRIR